MNLWLVLLFIVLIAGAGRAGPALRRRPAFLLLGCVFASVLMFVSR